MATCYQVLEDQRIRFLTAYRPSPAPWLTINADWPQEIEDFDVKNGTDILLALQSFGLRRLVSAKAYDDYRMIANPADFKQVFMEDMMKNEEGFCTEIKASDCSTFGGALHPPPSMQRLPRHS